VRGGLQFAIIKYRTHISIELHTLSILGNTKPIEHRSEGKKAMFSAKKNLLSIALLSIVATTATALYARSQHQLSVNSQLQATEIAYLVQR
jgi:hypothetical protein